MFSRIGGSRPRVKSVSSFKSRPIKAGIKVINAGLGLGPNRQASKVATLDWWSKAVRVRFTFVFPFVAIHRYCFSLSDLLQFQFPLVPSSLPTPLLENQLIVSSISAEFEMEPVSALSIAGGLTAILRRSALEAWAKRVGLGKELASLNKELAKIDSILSTYSQGLTQLKNSRRLKSLFFDAEDLVDELEYERFREEVEQRSASSEDSKVVSSSKRGYASKLLSKFKRSSPSSVVRGSELHALAKRMKELAELLQQAGDDVSNELKSEKLVDITISNWLIQSVGPVKTMAGSHISESKVFGRAKEIDYVIELLTGHEDADSAVTVVSIVGIGGIGKTTLAQVVYNDSRVNNRFEEHMWVTVSDDFGVARVAHGMLEQVSGDSQVKIENLELLQNKLADSLRSKRFLLVMDDVWNENEVLWESLLAPLKNGSVRGSKILVTTRMDSVARIVRSFEIIYLQGLEHEVFWNFFKSGISDDEWFRRNRNLEIIGRQIAKKLDGYPLAAKTMSALLKTNRTERFWSSVLDSQEWDVKGDILPALKLSYKNLPFHLQQCFMFCGLFPRGYLFNREYLTELWMAEGFIDLKGGRAEDVANEYFDCLVDYGFLERVGKDSPTLGHRSSVFVMHDLVHDLAKCVSSGEFLMIDDLEHNQIPSSIRHLSIISKPMLPTIPKSVSLKLGSIAANLQVLMLLGNEDMEEQNAPDSIQSSIKGLNRLKVLRLDATLNSLSLLSNISNLLHLRYLSLKFDLETLPEDICRLYHLQTLDLSRCIYLRELPKKFNNLVNLRHFVVADTILHSMIAGVSTLTSLQELSEFRVKTESEFGIEQLRNLKYLGGSLRICDLMNVKSKEEATEARLIEKKFLSCLSLSWDRKEPDLGNFKCFEEEVLEGLQPHPNLKYLKIREYVGSAIMPSWLSNNIITSLVNLELMYLEDCSQLETLPPLGELPYLKHLHLKSMHRVDEIGHQLYGSNHNIVFQSLENMVIEDMPALKAWHWSDGPLLFHALQVLEIKKCPKLRELPLSNLDSIKAEGDLRFRCLRSLVINECPMVEKLPALPHTHRLSHIAINGVGLSGEFYLSVYRGELQLKLYSNHNVRVLDEALVFYNLRNLRSLCIKRCPNLRSLSWESVCSLVWLNTLYIEECPQLVLPEQNLSWHESLSNLSTLEIVNCRNITSLPDSLQFLPSLNKLTLTLCESIQSLPEEALTASLEKLNVVKQDQSLPKKVFRLYLNFESLNILGYGGDNMHSRLFNKITTSLVNLRFVCLEYCSRLETLPPLGELPLLKQLHLKALPRVYEIGPQFYGSNHNFGFQSLVKIVIEDMPGLEIWHWVDGPLLFNSLQVLIIRKCPKLRVLPLSNPASNKAEGNMRFQCLRSLVIHGCPLVEKLPPLPITERLSDISIDGAGSLYLSFSLKKLTIYRCGPNLSLPKILPPSLAQFNVVEPDQSLPKKGRTAWLEELDAVELDRPLPQKAFQHRLNS
ncbi:hypothetical protein LUZ60_009069 [Juncus effusus]|nr:hypothetical protein LUZ60_009069 [Juncus effusus]